MTRIITHLVFILIISVLVKLNAQDFKGVATYKTSSSLKISLDSTRIPDGQQEQINAMLRKSLQKEYELKFTKEASNWKVVESLDKAAEGNSSVQVRFVGVGSGLGGGVLYKNIKDKQYIEQADVFGKPFLVKDSLQEYDWELTTETKQIAQYTCYKAIYTNETTQVRFSFGDVAKEERGKQEEKITQEVVAWYTPQIPVSHGPDDYYGLPGLILELNDGNRVMVCSKIVLNPEDDVVIEIPNKGKKVNREEYQAIVQEKAEEMQSIYSNGRKKGENGIQFRIGG